MTKRFIVLNVTFHQWNVNKNVNNVVLLKCTCCEQQRIGVAEQREKERYKNGTKVTSVELTFWYHGYDINYAEQLFNKLVQQRSKNDEDDYYEDDNDENNAVSNNDVGNKRNNDNKTLTINNMKITISNPRQVRGERR